MENISQNLQQFGLDEKETKVYLAVLSLGEASVSAIAKHAGIERTGTYDVLDRLVAQGLAKPVQTGKVIGFTAQNPRQFLGKLDSQKQQFVAILPHLEQLYTQSQTKPTEQFFEGEQFTELIGELAAVRGSVIRVVMAPEELPQQLVTLLRVWSKQNNEVRVLAANTKDIPRSLSMTARQLRQNERISLSLVCFTNTTVYIEPTHKQYGWRVSSPTVASLQITLFDEIWDRSVAD